MFKFFQGVVSVVAKRHVIVKLDNGTTILVPKSFLKSDAYKVKMGWNIAGNYKCEDGSNGPCATQIISIGPGENGPVGKGSGGKGSGGKGRGRGGKGRGRGRGGKGCGRGGSFPHKGRGGKGSFTPQPTTSSSFTASVSNEALLTPEKVSQYPSGGGGGGGAQPKSTATATIAVDPQLMALQKENERLREENKALKSIIEAQKTYALLNQMGI